MEIDMAYVTIEQRDVVAELVRTYGPVKDIKIEYTSEPYGLLWARWEPGGIRNLFVKPDGTRLSWQALE